MASSFGEWRKVGLAGIFYCVLAIGLRFFWGPTLLARASEAITSGAFARAALLQNAPQLIACIPMIIVCCYSPRIRRMLVTTKATLISAGWIFLATLCTLAILDALQIWPYFWRWSGAGATAYAAAALSRHGWGGILVHVVFP